MHVAGEWADIALHHVHSCGAPQRERGQALVLFALLLLTLCAAAGLMIDGGLAWGDRRQAQTAADMAALAAVKAKQDNQNIVSAAASLAAANGFASGSVTCAGVTRAGVVVNNPPAGGWTPPANLDPIAANYIEVIVTRRLATTFSAVIGQPCWLVSGRAVARFAVESTGAPGTPYPAILANNACNGSAVLISGNGLTVNGDVVSNSGISDPGNNTRVQNGSMNYVPSPTGCGPYPPPVPSGGDAYSSTAQTALTAYPITYTFNSGAWTITNDTTGASQACTFTGTNLTLSAVNPAPGIYCATGSITLNANQMVANVTLVAGGRIQATGSAPYNLTAFWDNLLAFSARTDPPSQPVINFMNGVTFTGLIFAPNGTPAVRGNNLQTSSGAVWGQTVTIDGNGMTLDSSGLGSTSVVTTTYRAGTLVE